MKITRRYVECAVFVAVWIAFAWIFNLSTGVYHMLGVPLVVLFQMIIARRPLQQLWVRDSSNFHLNRRDYVVVAALMLMPMISVGVEMHRHSWLRAFYLLFAVLGAFPAAFAVRQQRAKDLFQSLPSFIAVVAIGFTLFAVDAVHDGRSPGFAIANLPIFALESLTMFTICFVFEEVAFRGALDTHIFPVLSDRKRAWSSAIFISALWALWHLPNKPHPDVKDLVSMTALGVPFAFCWRRSGTLVLPALAHGLIDTYRNLIAGN